MHVSTSLRALLAAALVAGGAAAQTAERIPPRPVVPPSAFRQAVETGTRSRSGVPGAAYWQQRADYRIEASLGPSGRIRGTEIITYHNNSPDALPTILLRLEQNVYREGARRNRRVPITGGVDVTRLRVDGDVVAANHPGSGYYQTLTLLEVILPGPLASGDSARIEVDWTHRIPQSPTFRNGNLDNEVFAVAQWYPRVAVYDDVYGWDRTPYLGDGEFYLEYGDFDVRLTVPAGWLVGATGTLENPVEVVGPEASARLEAATTSETTVRIAEAAPTSGSETATWHFTAHDVRDFAFAASPSYVWDAAGAGNGILAQALYRPHMEAWTQAIRYTAHAIRTFSEALGPYTYPQLTMTEGPVAGMEYPMLVFNPGTDSPRSLASATIHEAGHQWFPMVVGNMEAKHAWMDEGFTTYWQRLSIASLWQEDPEPWGALASYLTTAGTEEEVPLMRHTDLVGRYGARTLAAYRKPAVALGALRSVLGDEVFQAAFRDFFETWKFRHPQPWDFFSTFERHAGRDLDWFWRPLFFETDVMDHAIESVSIDGTQTVIEVVDLGDVLLPTRVVVTLEEGGVDRSEISASRWLEEGRTVRISVDGTAARVELDPSLELPDVDRSNNVWTPGP